MRVFFDTNVLLDALLAREPFVADAAFLLEAVESGEVEGFLSATTITDIYYLVRRHTQQKETAQVAVEKLLALMEVCVVDRVAIEQALAMELSDFEDAVQVACATLSGAEVIVTRDVKGFATAQVAAVTPHDLRNQLGG